MLLKDEAERLDKRRMESRSRRPNTRVNLTETHSSGGSDEEDEAGFQTYLAFAVSAKAKEDGAWIDSQTFKKLSAEARSLWNKMSKEDKATILTSKQSLSINATQMDLPGETEDDDDGEEELNTALSINVTETQESKDGTKDDGKAATHPADINRMLSSSAAKVPATKKTDRKVNSVSWSINHATTSTQDYPNVDEDDMEEIAPIESEDWDHEVNWPSYEGDIDDHWGEDF